jgi:hypothetical protein
MKHAILIFVGLLCGVGEAQTVRQFVGTVQALKPETAEILVKPDSGEAVAVKVMGASVAQRIAPGERDLKNAKPIAVTEVAAGDRVLVALEPGTTELRRIVVMSATDIAARNEADRQDWLKRGVSGTVKSVQAGAVVLAVKGAGGEQEVTVAITAKTTFKKYPGDSVKFAEAVGSAFGEIHTGDQVRARGEKSADGTKVTAEDIVFGTFQTRVGAVVSFDAGTKMLTLSERGTGKTLTVKVGGDAQIKAMPDFAALMAGGGGMPPGGGRGAIPGGGPGGMPGGPPDIGRMIEMMPSGKLDDLQVGKTVIVSSTKTAKPDSLTAITMVVNADMLIQMAQMMSGGGVPGGRGGAASGMPGGMQGGMQGGMPGGMGMGGMGIDLSGITP